MSLNMAEKKQFCINKAFESARQSASMLQTESTKFEVDYFKPKGKWYSELFFEYDPSVSSNPFDDGGFWDQWESFIEKHNLHKWHVIMAYSPLGFPIMSPAKEKDET